MYRNIEREKLYNVIDNYKFGIIEIMLAIAKSTNYCCKKY